MTLDVPSDPLEISEKQNEQPRLELYDFCIDLIQSLQEQVPSVNQFVQQIEQNTKEQVLTPADQLIVVVDYIIKMTPKHNDSDTLAMLKELNNEVS